MNSIKHYKDIIITFHTGYRKLLIIHLEGDSISSTNGKFYIKKNQLLIVSKVGLIVIRRIQAVMVIGKKQKLQISMLNCNVTDPRSNA